LEHIQGPASEAGLAAAETVLDDARREAQAKGATRISAEPSLGDPPKKSLRQLGTGRPIWWSSAAAAMVGSPVSSLAASPRR
jgi:hypothetical protein